MAAAAQPQEPSRIAYSIAEAAHVIGLGRTTLYGLINSGRLASVKVGRRRVVRHADLDHLLSAGLSATSL